jgi:hypothetical protein
VLLFLHLDDSVLYTFLSRITDLDCTVVSAGRGLLVAISPRGRMKCLARVLFHMQQLTTVADRERPSPWNVLEALARFRPPQPTYGC